MQEIEDRGRYLPLTAPVVQYGFGTIHQRRSKTHRQHQDSNLLMNLAEASFQHLYPEIFRLQQYVLFHYLKEAEYWLSETFMTQLGQEYIQNGGSFSRYAGTFRKVLAQKWMRYLVKATGEGLLEKVSEEETSRKRLGGEDEYSQCSNGATAENRGYCRRGALGGGRSASGSTTIEHLNYFRLGVGRLSSPKSCPD